MSKNVKENEEQNKIIGVFDEYSSQAQIFKIIFALSLSSSCLCLYQSLQNLIFVYPEDSFGKLGWQFDALTKLHT